MIENEEFSEILSNPVRELVGRVELYIYEDSTLTQVCGCYDNLISFTIDMVGENKFFGYGICQKMNVKLLDQNRSINVSTDNYIEGVFGVGSEYDYSFPAFFVTEVNRDETTNQLSITAYDAIYKANSHTVSELGISSYTIRELATACADLLGLPLNVQSDNPVFDLEYHSGANLDGTETLREIMNDIAEVTQTIYFVNKDWELTFKDLDKDGEPVLTIGKADYFSLDSKTNRRLGAICHATELGDNITASINVSGTTQYIRDNPFLDLRDDAGEILQSAIDRIGGLTINQFYLKHRGNWLLEMGDKIAFVTKDDEVVESYYLNSVISYNGTLSEDTQWTYDDNSEETSSNAVTLGDALKQTYARVDKANRQIDMVASKVDENSNEIAAIQINTGSINASVERLEKNLDDRTDSINGEIEELTKKVEATMTDEEVRLEISEFLKNGVTSVTTTTGYTFNEDGMTVSKTNSEMETTISEDGMRITRNDEEVLIANNEGVKAEDLHATTYLIVGVNSRWEDYPSPTFDRTGVYWIGRTYVDKEG